MISTRSDACRHLSMMEYAVDRYVLNRQDLPTHVLLAAGDLMVGRHRYA